MAKAKGTGLQLVVQQLRAHREAVLERLPEVLHGYLRSPVLASSWYPEEDRAELLRVLAEVRSQQEGDVWESVGHDNARADLLEVYSAMVQRSNPWGTLQRLPRLWRLYHDTGRLEVALEDETAARIELHEYGYVDEGFRRFMAGYMATALELSGATDVEVASLEPEADSGPSRWRARWRR